MRLTSQRRVCASLMKCSPKRVKFAADRLEDIKEAITKKDIKALVKEKAIIISQKTGISHVRARKRASQKTKGRQRGIGKRKGKQTARTPKKRAWINAIRTQKKLLKALRDSGRISANIYHTLYNRSKGGFFRSRRHIQLYIKEHELLKK